MLKKNKNKDIVAYSVSNNTITWKIVKKKRWYECLCEKYYNFGFLATSLNANTGQRPRNIDLGDITT